MQNLSKYLVIFVSILAVSCVSKPTHVTEPQPELSTGDASATLSDGLTRSTTASSATKEVHECMFGKSDQYVKDAINSLQEGNEVWAKYYLDEAIKYCPEDAQANNLLEQIKADPKAYFKDKTYTKYKVVKGDSLSKLAKQYLKDELKFYILAKYNGIKNPSKLVVGETIRIPETKAPKISAGIRRLSADQHVSVALNLLQVGKENLAKSHLEAAIKQSPADSKAKNLLHQINTNPKSYFRQKSSFEYKVQDNDSLSKIAKKYLNDELQFWMLAKYNSIKNPSKLNVGQAIRIPGSKPPSTPVKQVKQQTAPTDEEYNAANDYYNAGEYADAIKVLEDSNKDSKSQDLLLLSYEKYADNLANNGKLLEAQTILDKAISIEPNNSSISERLKQVGVMKKNAAKSYHKQAMKLYREQKLNEAISYWDLALEHDPDLELAKLYRARAQELCDKHKCE